MLQRIGPFLQEKNLQFVEKLGKGYSSEIFLVKNGRGKKFVLKAERENSPRNKMVERETQNLEKANSIGIGPKLAGFDLVRRIILMEFIEGKTFAEWLFSNPSKEELKAFIEELLEQAKKLDEIGLDHGQLAGRGKNILVRKGKPVIIDFEKSSSQRKCHNFSTVGAFLFRNPHSAIAARVREILGEGAGKFISKIP